MSYGLKLIALTSFVSLGISIIFSLVSTRRFLKGQLRDYLLFINLTLLFILAPYSLWVINITTGKYVETNNEWIIVTLMLISALLFIESTKKLSSFSKVFGFNKRRK